MTVVDANTYVNAWNSDENQRIMRRAAESYAGRLSPDELTECQNVALFKTLRGHNDAYERRFTTNLWQSTRWECRDESKRKSSATVSGYNLDSVAAPPTGTEERLFVQDCLEQMSVEDQQLIRFRYYEGLSFKEIGEQIGLKQEAARVRVHNAEQRFKQLYLKGEEDGNT